VQDDACFDHVTLVLERPHADPELEPELAQSGKRRSSAGRIRLLQELRATFVR
jgi:hypothetical protein